MALFVAVHQVRCIRTTGPLTSGAVMRRRSSSNIQAGFEPRQRRTETKVYADTKRQVWVGTAGHGKGIRIGKDALVAIRRCMRDDHVDRLRGSFAHTARCRDWPCGGTNHRTDKTEHFFDGTWHKRRIILQLSSSSGCSMAPAFRPRSGCAWFHFRRRPAGGKTH